MSAAVRVRDITPQQWRTGAAAGLGWTFDGLELHIYTLVATPLVVQLLGAVSASDPGVKEKSAYIQAAFLAGWAVGGAFFGRLGDRLGRSRTLALTVLTSVIGRRPAERRILVDAGALALSKDRSTQAVPQDYGFGLALDLNGQPSLGHSLVTRANQEHGVIDLDPGADLPALPIGTKLRIAPNHACLTAAAHDRYYVVDGSTTVQAIWPRVNGW